MGLPAYNGEEYIARAISSILQQTHKDFELIVSDDRSSDSTLEIIRSFAKKDKRVKYFPQKKNIGFLKNYNFVLNKAKLKYFIWIGQDDFWDKTLLEKLYNLIEKRKDAVLAMSNTTNTCMVVTGLKPVTTIKNEKVVSEKYPFQNFTNKETRFESLLKFIRSGNLTFFYGLHQTANLKKVGGYQRSSRPFFKSSDYMTIFRVLLGGPMVFTNEYLFSKFDTGNYLTRYSDLKELKINKRYLKKVFRYLFFPLLFVYDIVLSIKYVIFSDFIFQEKLKLLSVCFVSYFYRNFSFAKDITIGVSYLVKGICRRVF